MYNVDNKVWSETIRFLRFPLIVGVIFIHTEIPLPDNIFEDNCFIWGKVRNIMYLFSCVLPAACVPLFFFISGFLFFYKIDFSLDVFRRKLLSRYRTLFVPYVIWNLIGFLFFLIKQCCSSGSKIDDNHCCITIVGFLNSFFMIHPSNTNPPFHFPLWFIRDLIVLVVLSPIIYLLVRKMCSLFVITLGIVWFLYGLEPYGFPGASHQSLFFFPLGAYCAINHKHFQRFSLSTFVALLSSYLVLSFFVVFCKEMPFGIYVHRLGIILGMIVYVEIGMLLSNRHNHTSFLREASFFIYVAHGLYIPILTKILVIIVKPESPISFLTLYFLIPIIVIALALIGYTVMKRLFPSMLNLLVGGR